MTPEQAKNIFEELFITFPHTEDYVMRLTNPQATVEKWKQMILSMDFVFAKAAIKKWESGDAEPPDKPWELGLLPLKLRAVAGRISDDAAKQERLRRMQDETLQRTQSRSPNNLGRLLKCSLDSGAMLREGFITRERNDEILRHLKSQIGEPDVDVPREVEEWRRGGNRSQSIFAQVPS